MDAPEQIVISLPKSKIAGAFSTAVISAKEAIAIPDELYCVTVKTRVVE